MSALLVRLEGIADDVGRLRLVEEGHARLSVDRLSIYEEWPA